MDQEDPQEKRMSTHSSFLPGEFYGQRSLVGYSPWGRKELDKGEQQTLTEIQLIGDLSYIRKICLSLPCYIG